MGNRMMRTARAATAVVIATTSVLAAMTWSAGSAHAAAAKKGAACSKAKVGQRTFDARNTELVCAKSGKKYVWKLTSAGDGGAVSAAATLPPAFAGTFRGVLPYGSIQGTFWYGLSQGDLTSAYYNVGSIVYDATTPNGCTAKGQIDGNTGQLAAHDKLTRYHITINITVNATCPGGKTERLAFGVGTTYEGLTTTAPAARSGSGNLTGLIGTPKGFGATVTAKNDPATMFEFTVAQSTNEARPAAAPAPAPA